MGNIQIYLIAAVLWVFFRCYYPLSVTFWLPPANWQGNIKTCIVFSGLYYCRIHWTLHCVGRMLKIVAKLSTSVQLFNKQCKNNDNWPTFYGISNHWLSSPTWPGSANLVSPREIWSLLGKKIWIWKRRSPDFQNQEGKSEIKFGLEHWCFFHDSEHLLLYSPILDKTISRIKKRNQKSNLVLKICSRIHPSPGFWFVCRDFHIFMALTGLIPPLTKYENISTFIRDAIAPGDPFVSTHSQYVIYVWYYHIMITFLLNSICEIWKYLLRVWTYFHIHPAQ